MEQRHRPLNPSILFVGVVALAGVLSGLWFINGRHERTSLDPTPKGPIDPKTSTPNPSKPAPQQNPRNPHSGITSPTNLANEDPTDLNTDLVKDPLVRVPVEHTGVVGNAQSWKDPINQRVLGDRRWMATASPAETARLQAVLDEPIPTDPRVKPADRRASIQAIQPEVDACVMQAQSRFPGVHGRLVVSYDVHSQGGTGQVSAVEIGPIVGFEQTPELADCIVERIDGLQFPTTEDGEVLRVQYPFFFENRP